MSDSDTRGIDDSSGSAAAGVDKNIRGYGSGDVDSVISVEEVTRQAAAIAEDISIDQLDALAGNCLLYTSPSPRDLSTSRMPSSA